MTDLVSQLKELRAGYLPEQVFFEMCRLNTLVSVEVLFKCGDMVYLTERNDKYFGHVWHIPGTMVRGNEDLNGAIARLNAGDFAGNITVVEPSLHHFQETPRGNIYHALYIQEIPETLEMKGRFFNIHELPENTLGFHREILERL